MESLVPAQAPADDVSPLVSLLSADLDAPRLAQQVHAACDRLRLDPAGRATVYEVIVRARRLVAEHENREKELTRLSKTAADLILIRDVDTLLSEIVDQARALLGTDVAYLSLWDPVRRYSYVRASTGTVSSGFGASVNSGTGLAGAIIASGRSLWTADYSSDDRFVHVDEADRGIASEGLVSFLGAPLMSKDSALGVIFVADRHTRQFTLKEVALLNSLAGHATIALHNANVFSELDATLEQLRSTQRMLEERNSMIEQVVDAHSRLMSTAVESGQLEPVVFKLADLLSAPVGVVASDHAILAAAEPACDPLRRGSCPRHSAMVTSLNAGAIEFLDTLQHTGVREPAQRHHDGRHEYLRPVLTRSDMHGWIYVERAEPLTEVEVAVLDRAVVVIALVLLDRNSVLIAEQGMRSDFLASLAANKIRGSELDQWAAQFGMNRRGQYMAVLCEGSQELSPRTRRVGHRIATERGGLAGDHRATLAMLLPGRSAGDLEQAVRQLQSLSGEISRVAISGDGLPLRDAHGLVREATAVLSWMRASGQTHAVRSLDDCGAQWLLFGTGADRGSLEWLVRRVLGRIIDTRAGADLLTTAQVYLASGSNSREAARTLHLHVNTVNQRLSRVSELMGDDWRFGSRALAVSAALNAWQSLQDPAPLPRSGRESA